MISREFLRQRILEATLRERDISHLIAAFSERTLPFAVLDLIIGVSGMLTQEHSTVLLNRVLVQRRDAPFIKGDVVFRGNGREHVVFKVRDRAVKVAKQSWAVADTNGLLQLANQKEAEHIELCQRYADMPGLVVPGEFVIGKMPPNNKEGLALVQPWFDSIACAFDPATIQLLQQHPLRKQVFQELQYFAEITLKYYDRGQGGPDLIGPRNVCVDLKSGKIFLIDSYELKLLDRDTDYYENPKFSVRLATLQQFVTGSLLQ